MKTNKIPKLKTGMMVLQRDGSVGIVIKNTVISNDERWTHLKDRFDLSTLRRSEEREEGCDIMKVSNVLDPKDLTTDNWTVETINDNLLWERPIDHIEVELNDEYTAKVFVDHIEVGCQTIPISKISSLQTAVKKLKEQQS